MTANRFLRMKSRRQPVTERHRKAEVAGANPLPCQDSVTPVCTWFAQCWGSSWSVCSSIGPCWLGRILSPPGPTAGGLPPGRSAIINCSRRGGGLSPGSFALGVDSRHLSPACWSKARRTVMREKVSLSNNSKKLYILLKSFSGKSMNQ